MIDDFYEKHPYWFIFIICLVGSIVSVFLIEKMESQPQKERIYQIVYGRVLCAKAEQTSCGINLKQCADSNEYYCMNNVFVESDK